MFRTGLLLTALVSPLALAEVPVDPHQVWVSVGSNMATGRNAFDLGFGYQLGYRYHFNDHLAVDAAWVEQSGGLGTAFSLGLLQESLDYRGATLGLKGTLPVSSWSYAFIRAGVNYGKATHEIRYQGEERFDYQGVRPYIGGGVGFRLGQHWDLTAEYQHIAMDNGFASNSALMGLGYRF
ncbi:porin family protein [Ferrimonas balearica]|uniref:porin family protein n=1 Tax=Ferrimonas balearica TaxID=44012 RepID=UPI001C98EEEC|nr:porin family protein [Ferrimonas balearica]MBY5920922.1 porin family protein [Ferrimonas balearica]MBY5996393.1 porin family protein [Ferrimonas balearica]